MDKSLHDRTAQFIAAINQGAIALDKTLAERSETFTNSLFQRVKALETAISQQTASLDKTMTERAQAVIIALAERLQAIDTTFGQRTAETDRMLGEHARVTSETFGKQTAQLNQVLANNSAMMQQTANQVGAQSKEAVAILTSQTQTLRDVSRGLLEQIHGLTQRFENQGQAILTAAKALDSSNTKIDSILEGRHQAIIAPAAHGQHQGAGPRQHDAVLCRHGGERDGPGRSPRQAGRQRRSPAIRRARRKQALPQIERLREEAQAHTARAVSDLKGSFETVITQIGRQLEQMRGTFDNTSRGMREAAQKTATDLDIHAPGDAEAHGRRCPSTPRKRPPPSAKPLAEQLKEIEAITPVLTRAATSSAPAPDPFRQAPPPARPLGFERPCPSSTAEDGKCLRPTRSDKSRAVWRSSCPAPPMRPRAAKASQAAVNGRSAICSIAPGARPGLGGPRPGAR